MLTRTQGRLLGYIERRIAADGAPPTFDQMRMAMGLRSKSGVHRLLGSLEERGFVRRVPKRAQAIELVRGASPEDGAGIPVIGTVAGHVEIAADGGPVRRVHMPGLSPEGHHALVVRGDLLAGAGILDGDAAVVRRGPDSASGDLVVAVVAGGRPLLRRIQVAGGVATLGIEGSGLPEVTVEVERVRVVGRLAGLLREY